MTETTKRSANHHLITISRDLAFAPATVYQAWADPKAKAAWFKGPAEWYTEPHYLDFRVGGTETSVGGPKGEWLSKMHATYVDIIPNERLIYTFTMHMNDTLSTVSLATVEFTLIDTGTRLILNEQIVFLDASDNTDHITGRKEGTAALIDQMEAYLKGAGS